MNFLPASTRFLSLAAVAGFAYFLFCSSVQAQPKKPSLINVPVSLSTAPLSTPAAPTMADYIVAVVNRELVTAGELQARVEQVSQEARSNGASLPPQAELRSQLINVLIDERVQLTHARETGQRVDDIELDRAVANVAGQNQLSVAELRKRLAAEGLDYTRFRACARARGASENSYHRCRCTNLA
jgi:peptidyl-prolyl cis-trans isomerase SurA